MYLCILVDDGVHRRLVLAWGGLCRALPDLPSGRQQRDEETQNRIKLDHGRKHNAGLKRQFGTLGGHHDTGGAGFALTESLLNTLMGLDGWLLSMLSRGGATMLHCFVGGLMGLAWYYLLSEQRWVRGLGLYAASVSFHGLWNALAGGLTLLSLRAVGTEQPWSGLGMFVALALLVILALVVAFGLVLLTRRVRERSAAAA